jgi:putative Ca2+/H+ antiporter (TMEM165/GDT1 family)
MGDKTQLSALALSANHQGRLEVLFGILFGLVAAGVLAFFAGRVIADYVSPQWIRYIAGSLFIAVGLWVLLKP